VCVGIPQSLAPFWNSGQKWVTWYIFPTLQRTPIRCSCFWYRHYYGGAVFVYESSH